MKYTWPTRSFSRIRPVARAELPRDLKGDVIVEVTIDAQGNVVETRILQAIGYGIDEKIVAALRQWRYQPATLEGIPSRRSTMFTSTFHRERKHRAISLPDEDS